MNKYLPNGTLGIALAGLLAAFMAGMAANVSSFNTVFTYDIWQTYVVKDRRDGYYLQGRPHRHRRRHPDRHRDRVHRLRLHNIMNYIQLLFSYFNAPLFATFIIAMFWKRATPWAGVSGLAAGTLGAGVMHFAAYHIGYFYPGGTVTSHAKINAQMANFYGAIVAFVADAVVTVIVSLVTKPKPREGTRRAGLGHPRSQCARPGVGAEAEVVGVAEAARRHRRSASSSSCPSSSSRRRAHEPNPPRSRPTPRSRRRPSCSTSAC